MSEEMVEAVARAICEAQGDDPEREGPFSEWWLESPYRLMAGAVLKAVLPLIADEMAGIADMYDHRGVTGAAIKLHAHRTAERL